MDVDQPNTQPISQSDSAFPNFTSEPAMISAPNPSSTISSMLPAPMTPSSSTGFNNPAFPTSIPNFPTPHPVMNANGPVSTSTTPLITPGAKRKRSYFQQEGEEDYLANVVEDEAKARIDEGSAAKVLRTHAPRPAPLSFNTAPLPFGSGFSFGQNGGTPGQGQQSGGGDVFGTISRVNGNAAGHNGGGGGMDVEMNMQGDQAQAQAHPDYFNRSIAPIPASATAGRRASIYSLCGDGMNPNIATMSLPSTPATLNDPPFSGNGMQIDAQMTNAEQQRALKESGIGVQPFSTDLQPPPSRVGLMQPVVHSQDGVGGMETDGVAGEVMKARSAHGPHCKTIPRLVLSEYPDPATGKRSMWASCSSCGSVEMIQT